MKAGTAKLCAPAIVMAAQYSAVNLVIPPFLHHLGFPVSAIGSLVSVAPLLTLAARFPSGWAYRGSRARLLMGASLLLTALNSVLYSLAAGPLQFALVHGLNGFANGAATTIYFALFVEALPLDESRHHAVGYYAGSLAVGYSAGGFVGAHIADRLGYAAAFWFAALVSLLGLSMIFLLSPRPAPLTRDGGGRPESTEGVVQSLRRLVHPGIAANVAVALFNNMLHQLGSVFFPLYGLAVGLTLTEVGVIRGIHSLCNAVTRPLSGFAVARFGSRSLSLAGLPLQAAFLVLVPLFHGFGWLLALFVAIGFLRAVVVVGNTIGMVEDMEKTRLPGGVASGILNAASDLGFILAPGFGGLVASFTGVGRLFYVAPVMILVLFWLSLRGCRVVGGSRRG